MLTKYKNILGVPKEGIHAIRLLDAAAIDYIGTIIGSIIISYFTKIPLVLTTIAMFILGILAHLLFGVETSTVKYLTR
jgi:hypothetical protein